MSSLNIIKQSAGYFVIDGDLTFATIDKQTLKSFNFLNGAKEITLDLSRVSSTDSAGLALMIEWIKYSRDNRTHIAFKNIPEQLLNLAKLSGFDQSSHFNEDSREKVQAERLDISA
ncbi:lipid asymmetry maintenance protein MlaB [Rhodoferax sp.]|uniref:STAS domain-containing protein n=1 Tax=Rhodoferax sp. TaxID=50421 RepID=UPI00271874C0|nr:STAS domain-containing protein [Rhodoferax sp.]MDO9199407.1 STAS domain-containing protein [Rhodoferax sp.]